MTTAWKVSPCTGSFGDGTNHLKRHQTANPKKEAAPPVGAPPCGSVCLSNFALCALPYGFGYIATGSFVIPRSFFCFSTIFATSARSFLAS